MTEWVAMRQIDSWLHTRGSSLRSLCDGIGLPGGNKKRSWGSVREEVQEFFNTHGRCPRVKDLQALQGWLVARGSSLRKLSNEMGLPGVRNKRGWPEARLEIRTFFLREGKRPKAKDLGSLDTWLRDQGSSVSQVCDEMEIPPHEYLPVRNIEDARVKFQVFYKEHGRRPTNSDFLALSAWLRLNESSLRILCDELALPGGRDYGRTFQRAGVEVRTFFQEHGRRPLQRELSKLDQWLRTKNSSLTKLCDEMGLPPHARRKR